MMALNNSVISTLCADGIASIKGIFPCAINDIGELSIALEKCLSQTNNKKNQLLFNDYLQQRSFEKFIQQLFSLLKVDAY
jgi:hypothetical protein